jgi:transcription elongation factor Elf1
VPSLPRFSLRLESDNIREIAPRPKVQSLAGTFTPLWPGHLRAGACFLKLTLDSGSSLCTNCLEKLFGKSLKGFLIGSKQ